MLSPHAPSSPHPPHPPHPPRRLNLPVDQSRRRLLRGGGRDNCGRGVACLMMMMLICACERVFVRAQIHISSRIEIRARCVCKASPGEKDGNGTVEPRNNRLMS